MDRGGDVARAAAIDGGEWTGAGSAPVAGGVRLQAAPRLDRDPSSAPARRGLAFAALASLAVHAAIVAAAALSLGAPQLTGEPDAIAVELMASTGEAPAAPTPAPNAESTRATPALRDDAAPSTPARADDAPPVPANAPQATAPKPTEASDVATPTSANTPDTAASAPPRADAIATPTPPKSADAANATDEPPPAPLALAPTPDAAQAVVASAPASPTPQSAAAPPEADFASAPAAPRVEPKLSPKPLTAARAAARLEPSARPSGARAASAPAPARGAAELAAYRNALLAKIAGAVRYPEAARAREATGVATVRFALDGAGAVTLADLAQPSGDRALDEEALAAVRRASPLPAPPAGAPRAYLTPIRFELR
jgi:protein TonB